jgi:hypothetical protein
MTTAALQSQYGPRRNGALKRGAACSDAQSGDDLDQAGVARRATLSYSGRGPFARRSGAVRRASGRKSS